MEMHTIVVTLSAAPNEAQGVLHPEEFDRRVNKLMEEGWELHTFQYMKDYQQEGAGSDRMRVLVVLTRKTKKPRMEALEPAEVAQMLETA